MEKTNTDKIIPDSKPGINLKNPFSWEIGGFLSGILGDWSQLLFDSSSNDAMRSITPPNEKDNNYINNQQQEKQSNNKFYIQQTLPKDFFINRIISSSSEKIHLNHETNNMTKDKQDIANNWKEVISKKRLRDGSESKQWNRNIQEPKSTGLILKYRLQNRFGKKCHVILKSIY